MISNRDTDPDSGPLSLSEHVEVEIGCNLGIWEQLDLALLASVTVEC